MGTVSEMDEKFYLLAREHIAAHGDIAMRMRSTSVVLEIGPQTAFTGVNNWDTLDIVEGCDIQADITKEIPVMSDTYDVVLCLDVLEHTVDPFAAVREIRRVMKPGSLLLASAPFNFRIHGPTPDLWRFTEHGWRMLLKDFDDLTFDILETPDRFLMPLHYNVSATCNKGKNTDPSTIQWRFIS